MTTTRKPQSPHHLARLRGGRSRTPTAAWASPWAQTSMRTSTLRTLIPAGVLAVLVLATLDVSAHAAELAGATLPDALSAGDKLLKVNGLGLRKKAMFKVYVGGLYLESPSKDAGTILATDQAKAIRMHFLRDLTKAQLVEAFQEGFEANAKDAAAQKAAFDKMLALVPDVKEGDTLTFTYLPGRGTSLHAGDKELGIFAGKGFADAVFSIWLGPRPPSEELKRDAGLSPLALWALVAPLCVALLGWMTLAIYFSPLEPPWMHAAFAALVPIGATIALIRVRPLRRVSSRSSGLSTSFSSAGDRPGSPTPS